EAVSVLSAHRQNFSSKVFQGPDLSGPSHRKTTQPPDHVLWTVQLLVPALALDPLFPCPSRSRFPPFLRNCSRLSRFPPGNSRPEPFHCLPGTVSAPPSCRDSA